MNANLYALLAAHFPESAEQPCLLIPDGPVVHYDELDTAYRAKYHRYAESIVSTIVSPEARAATFKLVPR